MKRDDESPERREDRLMSQLADKLLVVEGLLLALAQCRDEELPDDVIEALELLNSHARGS